MVKMKKCIQFVFYILNCVVGVKHLVALSSNAARLIFGISLTPGKVSKGVVGDLSLLPYLSYLNSEQFHVNA